MAKINLLVFCLCFLVKKKSRLICYHLTLLSSFFPICHVKSAEISMFSSTLYFFFLLGGGTRIIPVISDSLQFSTAREIRIDQWQKEATMDFSGFILALKANVLLTLSLCSLCSVSSNVLKLVQTKISSVYVWTVAFIFCVDLWYEAKHRVHPVYFPSEVDSDSEHCSVDLWCMGFVVVLFDRRPQHDHNIIVPCFERIILFSGTRGMVLVFFFYYFFLFSERLA